MSGRPWGRRAAEAALLLAVLAHYALFLDGGPGLVGPPSNLEDWPKEFRYYTVWQQALQEGRVPYFTTEPILITRKLLAIPEVSTSPQLLLLRVLPVGSYLVVNTLLLAGAGFAGLVGLRRRYGLGGLPFAVLVALFFGSGHITAQLAVGHSMWVGYFLLSWLVLLVLELVEDGPGPLLGPKLGLLLFALMLQGSFHVFVWCVLLLLLLAVFEPRLWPAVWRGLAWGAALSCMRLLPAFFVSRRREQAFLTGFPSLLDLLHGLVTVRDAAFGKRGGFFGQVDWWELDAYVGPAGLLLLVVFGLALARRHPALRGNGERALLGPLALLAVFSYGDAYLPLNLSGLPLLDAERATSRLLALPLVFLMALACIRLDRWLRVRPAPWRRAAAALLAAAIVAGLAWHSWVWRVAHLRALVRERRAVMSVRLASADALSGGDLAYVRTVQASFAMTVAAGALLLVRLRLRDGGPPGRSRPDPASTAPSPPAGPTPAG
jgi:hypothetical protein